MNARRIHGTKRTIQKLIRLCKRAAQEGLTEWRGGCMLWCSIWKDEQRLRLPASSKCIAPKSPSGCIIGNDGAWTGFWRDTGLAALKNSPIRNCGLWQTFWTVARWPMDSIPASGPARWSPGLLRKSFRFPIIQPMFPVSFNNWDSRSSAQEGPGPCRQATPIAVGAVSLSGH